MLKSFPERRRSGQLRTWFNAFARGVNMIRKFILAAAATAVATSVFPPSSFPQKTHKAKKAPCRGGQACTEKTHKVNKITGWGTDKKRLYEGKKYQTVLSSLH